MFKYVSERHVIDFIVNFEHIFAPCSSISIVNFEHVIASWERCAYKSARDMGLFVEIVKD